MKVMVNVSSKKMGMIENKNANKTKYFIDFIYKRKA